ncbi:molecular chaperone GrpE [Microbacterium mangrovi]|uniref:Protein GrpE n=1 Tax=Microbacterium mangrovi TaxID=1348253 RepID=A0A0B2A285_9MICO|nr:nucleotide exchange factor GrpE [Microbacterium mangrovi]KHK95904.1 molecular chaperone GrpE [Microbacterium mangrovi]
MAKDFENTPEPGDDEVRPGEGSEANASGPAPQDGQDAAASGDDELTVDDILGAAQTADAAAEDAEDAAIADLETQLLNDLKRLQAEYANYRRRTEEQRAVEIDRAKGTAIKALLPVLDDLDRAEKHGDLEEGSAFAAIAEKLRGVTGHMGVVSYGAPGEAFDPQQHEAIVQVPNPAVSEATILEVVEPGYRLGSVELRPAKVVVAVPAE